MEPSPSSTVPWPSSSLASSMGTLTCPRRRSMPSTSPWMTCPGCVEIHLSAQYVATLTGNMVRELTGILYHEMAHIWQWHGKEGSWPPQGLIEGIADFMRLKAKLGVSGNGFVGLGNHWDEGYAVTALFLNYVNDLHPSFVAELNKKLYDGWSESYFQDLTGKSVDQLWNDYKQKFHKQDVV
ncbi:uncharacterized protein LOC9654921 [Selaginella moellendorffii]|nr:uncharacterized protein LOC9654921 [Selaginella moellendorffii]|eukprot:XP_002983524.2 uncharacterized protein LOC9654921 [Selaginella moellendorffii]